jgi:hypothetical protein
MKLQTRFLLIFEAFLMICGAVRSASAENASKYRIAVIIPLSGNVASLGNYVRNGIDPRLFLSEPASEGTQS